MGLASGRGFGQRCGASANRGNVPAVIIGAECQRGAIAGERRGGAGIEALYGGPKASVFAIETKRADRAIAVDGHDLGRTPSSPDSSGNDVAKASTHPHAAFEVPHVRGAITMHSKNQTLALIGG